MKQEELKDVAAIKAYTKSMEHFVDGKISSSDRDNYRWGYIEGYLEAAANFGNSEPVIPTNFFDCTNVTQMTSDVSDIIEQVSLKEPSKPNKI